MVSGRLDCVPSQWTSRTPVGRRIDDQQIDVFSSPRGRIKQNHRGIDKSVLGVQLRRKWTNLIPEDCVLNFDRAGPPDPPGLLVEFFDRRSFRPRERFDLLYALAEVPDLIKRIPNRHLHNYFPAYIRNVHRHVEEMPFGMVERRNILNRCIAGSTECQDKQERDNRPVDQIRPGRSRGHRVFASLPTGTEEPSFFRSFSHNPSKLPLDMIRNKSPALASAARCPAIASELGKTRASFPNARTFSATLSGSKRFSSPSCCARNTPPRMTRSPSASAFGSAS